MKKIALLFFGIIPLLITTSTAWAAADITGFDGYKWGTKESVIQKATGVESKKQLNDHVSTIYHYKSVPGQPDNPQLNSRTYVLCGEEGLCAGKVKLRLKKDKFTVYKFTEKRIKAALGDRYGYSNSRARISDNQWAAKSGSITIASVDEYNITIWYRSPQYYATYKEYEKEIAADSIKKDLTTGFKF